MKQYDPLAAGTPAFRLKGSAVTTTVLELAHTRLDELEPELAATVARSPQLFRHSPLLVSLERLPDDGAALDLTALLALCRRCELYPIGLRSQRPDDLAQANALGVAVLSPGRSRELTANPSPAATANTDASATGAAPRRSRVVTQPVRGGQQVYADGDLILLAPVSAGAEVMADGHIHVYAPLRGRALAGVQGDNTARIFCRELSAELVAVAGHYRIADDLRHDGLWGRSAQVFLQEDELKLALL